jgi:hypothetical protein
MRDQASLYWAHFSTWVKGFGTAWLKPQYFNRDARHYNFLAVALEWAEQFGHDNIRVLNFHDGNAVSLFAEAAGFELPLIRLVKIFR